ncbi:MAG: 6-phospho-beta-glucosidase [Nocardioidaceae bacterium]
MRLTILGGGGFRVPLVYSALLRDVSGERVDHVMLYDVDAERLAAIRQVLTQMAEDQEDPPQVSSSTDLDEALDSADFVFSAIRVGGLDDRTADEQVALDLGVLGQETIGPGGVSFGLRTIPVAVHVASRVAAVCPDAWVINFTNPAGMITEAMQQVLGDRVVGICDSPVALGRRAARALGIDPAATLPDYLGLNHLGWLRGLYHQGRDVLPDLLSADDALAGIEEVQLFGTDWVRALGALPNEYLYYFYYTREAVAGIRAQPETRGQFLLRQQAGFYEQVTRCPDAALSEWQRVRRERDETYMADVRSSADDARDEADVEGGGYQEVALAFMGAIIRGDQTTMILNVCNGSTIASMPDAAVVEVPCMVDANGPHPLASAPANGHQLGLMQQVKAVEQLTIEAALSGSASVAVKALALHPLVDSVSTARALLDAYRARIPGVATAIQ